MWLSAVCVSFSGCACGSLYKEGSGEERAGERHQGTGGLGQGGAREQGGHPGGGGRCEEEEGRARTLSRSTIVGVI